MGISRRLKLALTAFALLAIGCKKEPDQAAPAPPLAPAKPATHLAPDELLEGTDHVFDLVLPRGARIRHRFVDQAIVEAALPWDKLIAYFKGHVSGGTLSLGDRKATFDHVHAKGSRDLRIVLEAGPFGVVKIELRDITPPPAPNLPDEASRWKAAGMTPDGKVIKTKLQ